MLKHELASLQQTDRFLKLTHSATTASNANVYKELPAKSKKFGSVLETRCIQVFLKWNGSRGNPSLFSNPFGTCLFLANLRNHKAILRKTPTTRPKNRILENGFHRSAHGKILCPVTVGVVYPKTKGSVRPPQLSGAKE